MFRIRIKTRIITAHQEQILFVDTQEGTLHSLVIIFGLTSLPKLGEATYTPAGEFGSQTDYVPDGRIGGVGTAGLVKRM